MKYLLLLASNETLFRVMVAPARDLRTIEPQMHVVLQNPSKIMILFCEYEAPLFLGILSGGGYSLFSNRVTTMNSLR